MRTVGNTVANETYGAEKVDPSASKEQKQRFVVEKYEKLAFAGKSACAPAHVVTEVEGTKAQQPEFLVRRAAVEKPHRRIVMVPAGWPSQEAARVKPASRPAACEADLPTLLLDELFREADDGFCGSPPLKTSSMTIAQPIFPPCPSMDDGLDSFLNETLRIQKAPLTSTAYPANLDPFLKPQAMLTSDPFADWPDF
jgi:hypothetical protein